MHCDLLITLHIWRILPVCGGYCVENKVDVTFNMSSLSCKLSFWAAMWLQQFWWALIVASFLPSRKNWRRSSFTSGPEERSFYSQTQCWKWESWNIFCEFVVSVYLCGVILLSAGCWGIERIQYILISKASNTATANINNKEARCLNKFFFFRLVFPTVYGCKNDPACLKQMPEIFLDRRNNKLYFQMVKK